MHFKFNYRKRRESDRITGIAPIFRLDTNTSQVHLIGTGFWISNRGHLVTALHVVNDNLSKAGEDLGPIFAIQTFADRSISVRVFKCTYKHPKYDLALSETVTVDRNTDLATEPITLSLNKLSIKQRVFSFSVLEYSQKIDIENDDGRTLFKFRGVMFFGDLPDPAIIKFAVRLSFGSVEEIFPEKRDSYMVPHPCVQSSVPIYPANSGGPLFDEHGCIVGVNCTSVGGLPVSFHIPIDGVLSLRTTPQSMKIKRHKDLTIAVGELAFKGKIKVEPPMLDHGRPIWSSFRWFCYAVSCRLRGEKPSRNVHIGSAG